MQYCDKPAQCSHSVTLKDYTGLDGCGWVFEEGGQVYEPINLGDFNLTLQDGATYYMDYEVVTDRASACMVGPLIRITCLEASATAAP